MTAVCTLFEGNYAIGVGSLINSLIQHHFDGVIIIGYRGSLPSWISQLKTTEKSEEFSLEGRKILFINLNQVEVHLGYHKPIFIRQVFEKYTEVGNIFYFDPDVVVNADWSEFEKWVSHGVALCMDNCYPYMLRNHPVKYQWRDLFKDQLRSVNPNDFYVNSGFIGLSRTHMELVNKWVDLTNLYKTLSGDSLTQFSQDFTKAVITGDQDLLNVSLSELNLNYSVAGTEAMGFTLPATYMYHNVGGPKVWSVNFALRLLKDGVKVSVGESVFFNYTNYPLALWSRGSRLKKKFNLMLAKLLGRVL